MNSQSKGKLVESVLAAIDEQAAEGRGALENLKSFRGNKLPGGDEVVIAKNLHAEIRLLKFHLKRKGVGLGEFCIDFGISGSSQSSKELHRLTLGPEKNAESVRLRKAADKYLNLIIAIGKVTGESASSIAERVLRGTRLHPAKISSLTESDYLYLVIEKIINDVDSEFSLLETYLRTAEVKSSRLRQGVCENDWPFADLELDSDEMASQLLRLLTDSHPADASIESKENASCNKFVKEWRALSLSASHSFWRIQSEETYKFYKDHAWPFPTQSNILQETEFFYVPHAPLGLIEFENLPADFSFQPEQKEILNDIVEGYHKKLDSCGQSIFDMETAISDDWDSIKKCPRGQIYRNENNEEFGRYFSWVVIYPSPDSSKLIPAIYIAYEEGGPYLLPLNPVTLEVFRNAVWIGGGECKSVFDRLLDLVENNEHGQNVLSFNLKRTAPWLAYNPILKFCGRAESIFNSMCT